MNVLLNTEKEDGQGKMQHRGSAVPGILTEALAANLQRLTSNHAVYGNLTTC